MSDPRLSDPHVLDQPWRIWASVVVIGILLFVFILLQRLIAARRT